MDFKRCNRCGNFFVSDNDICYECEIKDRADISKLNTILGSSSGINSVNELSANSGVNPSNINRFIKNNFISF
ncbi:MAG: hypothetical protein J6A29_03385 [Clostridia bacterium]|nr:hypothetical protein [Clostridia bacterium]